MTTFAPNTVSPTPVQHITRRQWLTARIAAALGLPAPKVGKRRAGRARKPAPASYMLSPAATQLVTRTDQQIHADPEHDTGLIDPRRIIPTGAFTPGEDR